MGYSGESWGLKIRAGMGMRRWGKRNGNSLTKLLEFGLDEAQL